MKNKELTEQDKLEIVANYKNSQFPKKLKIYNIIRIIPSVFLGILTGLIGLVTFTPILGTSGIIILPVFNMAGMFFCLHYFGCKQRVGKKFNKHVTDKIKYKEFKKLVKSGEFDNWVEQYERQNIEIIAE